MPVHDWTRVEAKIFHGFHTTWIAALNNVLNEGLLPEDYYALPEQHAGRHITDILTLHAAPDPLDPIPPLPPSTAGVAVAEAPPRVRRKHTLEFDLINIRRSLAIRHVSGHRLVALLEIVSPANKDRPEHVENFAAKAPTALEHRVHLLMIDLFPPGPYDPQGMHQEILSLFRPTEDDYDPPPDEPLTLASCRIQLRVEGHVLSQRVHLDCHDPYSQRRPR